ncbi:FKBP-type peptidyl-prolyl cis-trans isomerase [Moraxella nasicaprae]
MVNPPSGALIAAHCTGYLADGTVFDSSHHRG